MYSFYMDNARKTPLKSEETRGEKIGNPKSIKFNATGDTGKSC